MCGIYGMYNFDGKKASAEKLCAMEASLAHRGPDSRGCFVNGNTGLGAVRLSVLDLSERGNQPFFSRDKRFCMVYNGEVYNFIELRERLSPKYKFSSGTDTEVVLYAFLEWGQECLDMLNGMFAFAVYDTRDDTLFLARDRFGIKPLYYYRDDKKFVFSSELKAFKAIFNRPTVNETAMYNYLVFNRTDYDEDTFFKDIKRLPHGHKILINREGFHIKRWYNLPERLCRGYGSPEELRHDLGRSIKLRLRSDVPVGVCLSGGVDSSSITSILLDDLKTDRLQTFSVVYGENKFGDESEYIGEFKNRIGDDMHTCRLTSRELLSDIDDFTYYIDEPVPRPGPYIHYHVMKLAKRRAVVLLDGQGGDEEFAGYHYFFGFLFRELAKKKNIAKLFKEIAYYLTNHRSSFGIKAFLYFSLPDSLKSRVKVLDSAGCLSRDFTSVFKYENTIPEFLYRATDLREALLQHFEHKLEHLLKWEDRNSMRFSLESRVPFLDHHIVERALSLPSDFIIRNGQTKWILREALKDILPPAIMKRRDKIGFDNPCAAWFREDGFEKLILQILHSKSFKGLPYFNTSKCLDLYRAHRQNRVDATKQIWKWINTELWYNKFIRAGV